MKKVCIIATSLSNGGAERFSALLSQMLAGLNYDVHILITKNSIDYNYSGSIFNLYKETEGSHSSLKKALTLKSYFNAQSFDFIIDNRPRQTFIKEYLLYKFIFKARHIIPVVHSFYLKSYFPKSRFLAKILYQNNSTIVTVSKAIQEEVIKKYQLKNCHQIYNAIDFKSIEKQASHVNLDSQKFILFYGRLEESVKNFSLLLTAYKKSNLINHNIKLYIVGSGEDLSLIKNLIKDLKLNDWVQCKPYIKNPFTYVKKALFTVLTSKHEGFPMVLIESLACQTPVVSVDCKSGPKEIIKHEENGLLVENYNSKALALAFNQFVANTLLYNKCKENSKKSVSVYSTEYIAKKWDDLLKSRS
ncbi:glycosyltransferase [Algibacter sp. PT7-4]|uniref:glycosyltransferase n=1 Tax=Algibacter ulvanivorans TaxID=3400999 RepID=UPI003AABFE8D